MPGRAQWPEWWSWELELSHHVLQRMTDRGFSEVDLRAMLDAAAGYRENCEMGRWVVATSHEDSRWEVIVEPLEDEKVLLVITAYPTD